MFNNFGINFDSSNIPEGYSYLAGLSPLYIPVPEFNKNELQQHRSGFRSALEKNEPFFLPLEKASKINDSQIDYPLEEMPLYIPRHRYKEILHSVLGESDFINPFLTLMLNHEHLIPQRRYPLDMKLSALEGHYLPVSIAGAMLSKKNAEIGKIDSNQANSTRFNPILGLFHDGPEDDIFEIDDFAQIKSKDTNGQLYKAIKILTRNGTKGNPDRSSKEQIYDTYGEKIGLFPNLTDMKWIDISASCLQDLLNGVERSKDDLYIIKQGIVLTAMGRSLKKGAGKLLPRLLLSDYSI